MPPMNNRLLRPTNNYDADALRYINAVQVADGQALEPEVRTAIDAFVRGCKSDSAGYAGDPTRTVWDALQACCIMAGARTISGALVPLVGDAPTPYNLTNFDYDRTTGIKGDGSTTYLDSGRANNADGQNDFHISAYATQLVDVYVAAAGPSLTVMTLATSGARNRSGTSVNFPSISVAPSLMGTSRSDASNVTVLANSGTLTTANASSSPGSDNIKLFGYIYAGIYSANRLAFYSIGSAIPNLASLDARVTTLISSIATALS